jgi:hypothetical protein
LTRFSAGRSWRVYQKLLLQVSGFLALAVLAAHQIRYEALPFFSLEWIVDLVLGARTMSQWSVLMLLLFCLWLSWRGGNILIHSPRLYLPVCLHFDKGLGLFFLLLVTKAFVMSRFGIDFADPSVGFMAIAYIAFSLTAIAVARNQGMAHKSFLSGYHGIGVILSVVVIVTLLFGGMTFLFYPYLTVVADSALVALKDASQPVAPVLIGILRFLLRPKHLSLMDEAPYKDSPPIPDLETSAASGWETLLQSIAFLGMAGIIGIVLLIAIGGFAFYMIRLLLVRNQNESVRLPLLRRIVNLLGALAALPFHAWREVTCFLKGIDCAAGAYVKMIRWGRRSGVALVPSETPAEYGNRLMSLFPGLGAEITLIVEAFNREVYGQKTIDGKLLSGLRSAHRHMKRLRHWPLRIKRWFLRS